MIKIERGARLLGQAQKELKYAYSKHGSAPWGRHEFYGILREEFDELWDIIKSDGPQHDLMAEAAQIIAVCLRYAEIGDRYGE